jgi:hypothetical protein
MSRSNVTEAESAHDTRTAEVLPSLNGLPEATTLNENGKRRERRSRRVAASPDPIDVDDSATGTESLDSGALATLPPRPDGENRRTVRGERRHRPRAPRAEQSATPVSPVAAVDQELEGDPGPVPEDATEAAEALVINLSGKKPNRGGRTLKRARRKQQDAAAALAGAESNPALGALNRHLNMMMQQLGTAHRVIGRIAAERDALRQQLADLQGIPVEEIVVTSLGASSDQPVKASEPAAPQPKTGISRLNYFGGEDVAVMRKRRQMFVLFLLVVIVALWVAGRMGAWTLPDNLSRDSLARLPFIGEFMSYFLAGWLLFRFVKVSSKGVKWVFPSDDPRRRRR